MAGDDFLFVHGVVRAGAGIGAMPSFLARQELAAGTLVRVLPEWKLGNSGLYIVHASSRHAPRKVVAFRDFVLESFRSLPLV